MKTSELILSDLFRHYGRVGPYIFLKAYFLNRGFKYMFWFRCADAGVPILSYLASLVLRFKQIKYGIQVLRGTTIGHGFYIAHNGPCIIHPSARIGNNVNISQFVTIGSNHGRAATIGDNVYIGPNTVLVEDVVIGSNVTIGAGSVVVHSVNPNCTVAGNPARVLNQDNPGRYVNRRWKVLGQDS